MNAVLFALVYRPNNLSHFILGCFIFFCGSPQQYSLVERAWAALRAMEFQE